jgi:opacity protein-like surface antigen
MHINNKKKEVMKLINIKNSQLAVIGGVASLAACATTMQAEGVQSGWYVSSDAGLNLMPGVRGGGHANGNDIRTDAGMRYGLEAGYGFKLAEHLTLGAEAESGIIYNGLSSIKSGGAEQELGGNLYQVPILANFVMRYQYGKWAPYVGVGGGLDYISANVWSSGNGPVTAAGSDFGPAVQALAGVKYQLSDKWELGLGYKYLAALSEKLGGDIGDRLSTVNNHSISLSVTYHF